jgi:transposase
MVWEYFCNYKVRLLVLIEGRLNAKKYIHTFQDDNAPAHSARLTKNWKEQNLHQTLIWPSQNPDLNPIENLWDVLERRVRIRSIKPKNKPELMIAFEEEWHQLEPKRLLKLVESMPRRIKAVINSKGILCHISIIFEFIKLINY